MLSNFIHTKKVLTLFLLITLSAFVVVSPQKSEAANVNMLVCVYRNGGSRINASVQVSGIVKSTNGGCASYTLASGNTPYVYVSSSGYVANGRYVTVSSGMLPVNFFLNPFTPTPLPTKIPTRIPTKTPPTPTPILYSTVHTCVKSNPLPGVGIPYAKVQLSGYSEAGVDSTGCRNYTVYRYTNITVSARAAGFYQNTKGIYADNSWEALTIYLDRSPTAIPTKKPSATPTRVPTQTNEGRGTIPTKSQEGRGTATQPTRVPTQTNEGRGTIPTKSQEGRGTLQPTTQQTKYSITVRIREGSMEKPVEKIVGIRLTKPDGTSISAGPTSGEFKFTNLTPGLYKTTLYSIPSEYKYVTKQTQNVTLPEQSSGARIPFYNVVVTYSIIRPSENPTSTPTPTIDENSISRTPTIPEARYTIVGTIYQQNATGSTTPYTGNMLEIRAFNTSNQSKKAILNGDGTFSIGPLRRSSYDVRIIPLKGLTVLSEPTVTATFSPNDTVENISFTINQYLVQYQSPTIAPQTPDPTEIPEEENDTELPIISTTPSEIPAQSTYNADLNNDKSIDRTDFEVLSCEIVGNGVCSSTGSQKKGDINKDGIVNLIDFIIWRNSRK